MSPRALIRNCSFRYKCGQSWDSLAILPSYDSSYMRYCKKCNQKVYWVGSESEILMHVEANHCVAISFDLTFTAKQLNKPMIGVVKLK